MGYVNTSLQGVYSTISIRSLSKIILFVAGRGWNFTIARIAQKDWLSVGMLEMGRIYHMTKSLEHFSTILSLHKVTMYDEEYNLSFTWKLHPMTRGQSHSSRKFLFYWLHKVKGVLWRGCARGNEGWCWHNHNQQQWPLTCEDQLGGRPKMSLSCTRWQWHTSFMKVEPE